MKFVTFAGLPAVFYDTGCDKKEELEVLRQDWDSLKGLVDAGLLYLGGKCDVECIHGTNEAACVKCMQQHGLDAAKLPKCT